MLITWKFPKSIVGRKKTPSWATCGPRVWDPWSNTRKQDKTKSHITLPQVGSTDQSQPANIRVGLCWL